MAEALQVTFNTKELDISLREADDRMLRAVRRGFGKAMSRVKERTKNHINKNFRNLATQRIANSLDSEIEVKKDRVEAIFGSRGPDAGTGEIGVGLHGKPDDDGNRWNIAQMYNEGISPKSFTWKSPGAAQHGRQAGRKGGNSPWIGPRPFFYGAPRLAFIDKAREIFNNIAENTVKREIDKEFNEVI